MTFTLASSFLSVDSSQLAKQFAMLSFQHWVTSKDLSLQNQIPINYALI